ncbi:MAG: hypothetical protein M1823_008317, partial [Watsoniomyces obsoletus]
MDATGISMHVISHAPGPITPQQCRDANDELYTAVQLHPTRFAGFAVLPVSEPDECAKELERCVSEMGFVGVLIDNHTSTGTYFDSEVYDILWSTAQSLNVPIYLHPTWPTPSLTSQLYTGNFPLSATASLGASGFGWHAD